MKYAKDRKAMARRLRDALNRSEYRTIDALVTELNKDREKPLRYETVRKWFADGVGQVHSDMVLGLEAVCSVLGVPYADLWTTERQFDVKSEINVDATIYRIAVDLEKLLTKSPVRFREIMGPIRHMIEMELYKVEMGEREEKLTGQTTDKRVTDALEKLWVKDPLKFHQLTRPIQEMIASDEREERLKGQAPDSPPQK